MDERSCRNGIGTDRFDGDGKSDLATYQEATGQWNVMLSASSYGVTHATFGGPGFVPVQ